MLYLQWIYVSRVYAPMDLHNWDTSIYFIFVVLLWHTHIWIIRKLQAVQGKTGCAHFKRNIL